MLWPRGHLQPKCFCNSLVRWRAAKYWEQEGVCVFRGGQRGRLHVPLGQRGAQAALGTNTPVLARRQGSVCAWCTKHNHFGFFGKGLRKVTLCLWTWLALKREHPSFSKWPSPHLPFFVLFCFVSSVAPECLFFLRLWENELRISFGLVPKLKMKSLFHLAYIYSKDSCTSAVQEQHEECIGWSSSGILQCYTAI